MVDVANEAMLLIGMKSVQSLDDPKNSQDRAVAQVIDGVRRDLILMHRWNGATKRVSLARDAEDPAFQFEAQYVLPSDLLRLDRTIPQDQIYKIEGNKLLTDSDVANIVYMSDEKDPNVLGQNFQMAMKFLLASRVNKALSGDERVTASMRNEFDNALAEARYIDSDQASAAENISPGLFITTMARYGVTGSGSTLLPPNGV